MYAITIVGLVVLGLVFSAAYVLTWTPAAVKARYFRTTSLSTWDIIDFAALPAACFAILLLNLVNIAIIGIPPPVTHGTAVQRISTIVLIDAIVILRCIRWYLTYRDASDDDRLTGAVATQRRQRKAS